jgi:hypothetical protein
MKKPANLPADRIKRVPIKYDGQDYTFGVDTNMLCNVEEALGVSFIEAMQSMSMATMRVMLSAGLKDEDGKSVKDVAPIIDACGPTNIATILAERVSAFSAG